MEMKFLQWDSDFFGFRIFSVHADHFQVDDLQALQSILPKENADLVYIFLKKEIQNASEKILENCGARLADIKIIYEKKLEAAFPSLPEDIIEYNGELTGELSSLAFSAGEYSRFRVDEHLSLYFEKMYDTWLMNSLQKKIADKTFVVQQDHSIKGFVTCKISGDTGTIGLIATAPEMQGKGFGKKLMQAVEFYYFRNAVNLSTVATQSANQNACRFYETCGYHIQKKEYIYHLWAPQKL